MARRRDLSNFERGVSKENRGFKGCVCLSDLNPIEHLWEILERCLRWHFPSTKHKTMEFLVEEWCRNPPIEFQTLVGSMLKHIEAVVVAQHPLINKPVTF
jgi:hypothetical protein